MNKISWWRTSFGKEEVNQIADSIRHENISQGPVTAEFEKRIAKILDVPYVVATTSGSMALLMALIASGVSPGDEVIVPNRTWIATAHAPLLLGAKVVLVDVEPNRPVMDVTKIKEKITKKTKVIIPVHLNGRSVAMKELNQIADSRGIKIIEDAAQAFCSRNEKGFLGTQSYAGCFSLSVAKLISTGQGGFIVIKNRHLYQRLKTMRTHGVSDLVNVSYTQMGFNFRLTDIQASIGVVQLGRLKERIRKIKAIYKKYSTVLCDFPFLKVIPVDIEGGELPIYIEVLCAVRDRLIKFFAQRNIQTRPFFPSLNTAKYFKNNGQFPNSEVFSSQGCCLPCGPAQPFKNVDYVIEVLRDFGKRF